MGQMKMMENLRKRFRVKDSGDNEWVSYEKVWVSCEVEWQQRNELRRLGQRMSQRRWVKR